MLSAGGNDEIKNSGAEWRFDQLKQRKLRSVIFNDLASAKYMTFKEAWEKYDRDHEKGCQALLKKKIILLCLVDVSIIHYRSPLFDSQWLIGVSSYAKSTANRLIFIMDSPFFCLIDVTTSIMAHIYDADAKSGRVHFISQREKDSTSKIQKVLNSY